MTEKISFRLLLDFYLLEAMLSYPPRFGKRPQEALHRKIKEARDDLADKMGRAFYEYLYLASFAEARHIDKLSSHDHAWYFEEMPQGGSRSAGTHEALNFDPKKCLPRMSDLFHNNPWGSGYGNESWGKICDAAYLYHKLPANVFVDHVIDLKHNNGLAFSKAPARKVAGLGKPMGIGGWSFYKFLDWKAEASLIYDTPPLVPLEWGNHVLNLSSKVYVLADRWWPIFLDKQRPKWYTNGGPEWPYDWEPTKFGTNVIKQVKYFGEERIRTYVHNSTSQAFEVGAVLDQDEQDTLIYGEGQEFELPEEVPLGDKLYLS